MCVRGLSRCAVDCYLMYGVAISWNSFYFANQAPTACYSVKFPNKWFSWCTA